MGHGMAVLLALTLGLTPVGPGGGSPATFGTLKVGQVVSVDGKPAGTRAVLARIIEIEGALEDDHIKGPIAAVNAGEQSLTVLGVKVVAGPDAAIADRAGRPLALSALQRGWVVKAKGRLRQDKTLRATEIKVSDPAIDEAAVQGRIQALDRARRSLTVIGLTIRVAPDTRITLD